MPDKQILIRDMNTYEPIITRTLDMFSEADLSIIEALGILDIIRDELHGMRYLEDEEI